MRRINRWILSAPQPLREVLPARCANIWYNQDYTVYGLNKKSGKQKPNDNNTVRLYDLGDGTIALRCGGGYNAFASTRDDYDYQVHFQVPKTGQWITWVEGNEHFQAKPTGDGMGYFALYSPKFGQYLTISQHPDKKAHDCNALAAKATVIGNAARFTAEGLDRNIVFDFLEVGGNATGFSLTGVNAAYCDWTNKTLSGCDFRGVVSLNDCILNGAHLQSAWFTGLSLAGVQLSEADCTAAQFAECDFTAAVWTTPPILTKANLTGAVMRGSLAGAKMAGAVLAKVDLTGYDLSSADLTGVDLRTTTVTRCNLSKANLSGANLAGLDLTTVTLVGANLAGANLSGAKLGAVDLTGANLAGTNFTGTDLRTVRFSDPWIRSTDPNNPTIFADCDLPYTVIGLNWSCLDLTKTRIDGLPTHDLTGLVAHGAQLRGARFANYTLDRADFSNATLDGTDFSGASLHSASFTEARLTKTFFVRAVLDQTVFTASALGGIERSEAASFSFAFISNCNFTEANLYGVIFADATMIGGNTLRNGTNLMETDFSNAYLPNADFTGANLQGAKFDGAFMVECVLTNADLSPAQRGAIPASLASACLQAAALDGTNLKGANLANAAITDGAGKICEQHYGADGQPTPMFPMHYPAGAFPTATSFDDATVCPNLKTYRTNVANGRTIAAMMTAPYPPTKWTPRTMKRGD